MMYNILIQGPLNRTSLEKVEEYKQYGQVVISYWYYPKDETLLEELAKLKDVIIVGRPEPDRNTIKNLKQTTFLRAVTSQYTGLLACTQPYVIKTRSDEKYHIRPLIKKFEQNKNKIVFGNIFYLYNAMHIGDHIFVGATSVLKQAMKNIYNFYWDIEEKEEYWELLVEQRIGNCAEIVLCKSILLVLGLTSKQILDRDFALKFIQENFEVIDIDKLKPFIAKYTAKYTYKDHFTATAPYKVITDIQQTRIDKV